MRTLQTAVACTIIGLSGCATCERHPVECGALVGIVATSIALSVNQIDGGGHHSGSAAKLIIRPPMGRPPLMTSIPQDPTGPTTY